MLTSMWIVTGASSGIGAATARSLIERGREVAVVARRREPLEELRDIAPDRVRVICADIGSEQGIADVVAGAEDCDRIAGVVHAAGTLIAPCAYTDLDHHALVADMAVHVAAPIALNAALKAKLTGGRVLYVDSYSATALRQGWSGYSIVKAAAQMAALAADRELEDVSVIRAFPGGVRTPLVEGVLASDEGSPTAEAFRLMDARGELVSPDTAGAFIAGLLLDTTDAELVARDTWVFSARG